MKYLSLLSRSLFILFPLVSDAQGFVLSQPVSYTNINLRDSLHILARIDAFIPAAGDVVIHFNGECYPDVGDRIILAGNNGPFWTSNYGNIGVQTTNYLIGKSFSHTRVATYYENDIGMHSFYAVGQNFVDMGGTGIADIIGTLTIEFIPFSTSVFLAQEGFVFSGDLTNTIIMAQQTIHALSAGKVIVRVDGWSQSDVGDLIVVAVSNTTSWLPNDGNVTFEAADAVLNINTYCHTRVYDVPAAGDYTYYALAQNVGETDGSGMAHIYGLLVAEFYADAGTAQVSFQGFSHPALDLNGPTQALTSITINAPGPGKVLVDLDGDFTSDPGDYIILAASNSIGWSVDDGNVTLQGIDNDLNRNIFSHSRVYAVDAGSNTFYGVGQNSPGGIGSGIVNIFGELTVKYFPDQPTATEDVTSSLIGFDIYPDPTEGMLTVSLHDIIHGDITVKLLDIDGHVLPVKENIDLEKITMDLSSLPSGVYFVRSGLQVKKVMKM